MSEEQEPSTPNPAANDGPVISPAVFQIVITTFAEWLSELGTLRTSHEKTTSALVSYMDRIVLLAGGTLTLIFTVIGGISTSLHATGRQAHHIVFVMLSCWFLVVTIISALLYNVTAIKLQHQTDRHLGTVMAAAQFRFKLMTLANNVKVGEGTENIGVDGDFQKNTAIIRNMVRYSGSAAQVCLVCAFVFLALFIQSNLPLLLNNGK